MGLLRQEELAVRMQTTHTQFLLWALLLKAVEQGTQTYSRPLLQTCSSFTNQLATGL
jgi:hypothetical protein